MSRSVCPKQNEWSLRCMKDIYLYWVFLKTWWISFPSQYMHNAKFSNCYLWCNELCSQFKVKMSSHMTKPTKWYVHPVKTQISLGIRPVWSESSLSAWRKHGSLATHSAHSEDSDQTGRMPRLIWVFTGCTLILLVLSSRGSFLFRDRTRRAQKEWHLVMNFYGLSESTSI